MTGFGEARHQGEQIRLAIELRALNNRYLKLTVRAPEPYHLLEAEFEKVVRRTIRRGTLLVQVRIEKNSAPQDFRVDPVALESYVRQVRSAGSRLGLEGAGLEILLGQVLALPGVVPEPGSTSHALHEDWPLIEEVLGRALEHLQAMRREEGKAMAQELTNYRNDIAARLEGIRTRAPQVVALFRDRLHERVRQLLGERDVQVDRNDLIREVSIFAERSDVAEEIVRLAAHLDHFLEIMQEVDSPGRKLEFLVQEMTREANTIGSKASDVEISRQVVEIKGTLEKIRELVQNIE